MAILKSPLFWLVAVVVFVGVYAIVPKGPEPIK